MGKFHFIKIPWLVILTSVREIKNHTKLKYLDAERDARNTLQNTDIGGIKLYIFVTDKLDSLSRSSLFIII